MSGVALRVRGLVQGVGFRPTVWRLARECGLTGDVRNDGEGVLVRLWGEAEAVERFCQRLHRECPPLARIDAVERLPLEGPPPTGAFRILPSDPGPARTGVVADAATCPACQAEIQDPGQRRYRYPFTNCTHCGPRLSIIRAIPYDRANTAMAGFPVCPACAAEYQDPADRRFHAQPIACPECGPRAWLEDGAGQRLDPAALGAVDAIAAASQLLRQGHILAIKGIGGFHLAVDATQAAAVGELRRRKARGRKPFALMARDLAVIRRYCQVEPQAEALLGSPAAPIVLLPSTGPDSLAPQLAPGQAGLGWMLPYSPLHHLLLADWDRPLVMTSGNLSDEPQCIDNAEARARLGPLADYCLLHDRPILNRLDDSVARIMDGAPRLLRRARGYAPTPIPLPPGFGQVPPILALGGELKATFCLVQQGQAILSQHLGDLEDPLTAADYEHNLDLYQTLFQHRPRYLVVDRHPDYRSTRLGRDLARREGLELVRVQHHFAHIAAVLADNDWPLDGGKVLGVALDGLGHGEDGSIWGGEFLLADYRDYRRVGYLRPVPMPGGGRASREPWRNAYAQLVQALGWETYRTRYPDLPLTRLLADKPLDLLDLMLTKGINSPLASSCGRLFDAVAATLGICPERISYDGEAASELEALAWQGLDGGVGEGAGYPLAILPDGAGCLSLDPAPLWAPLLEDLARGEAPARIAARFHQGLAGAVADLAQRLAKQWDLSQVALSGGVFQNRLMLEGVSEHLRRAGLGVLSHRRVPANDNGLALGQALIAAARLGAPEATLG